MYSENDDVEFDSLFREKLGNESMQPSPMAWENIEKRLDEKNKKRPGGWIWFGAGALVIIIATLSIIFYPTLFGTKIKNNSSLTVNNTKATAEKENSTSTQNLKDTDSTITDKKNNLNENKKDSVSNSNTGIEKSNSGAEISDFRIQLGIFKNKKDLNKFSGLDNVSEVQDSAGRYHYYAGPFTSLEKAKENQVIVLSAGYAGAFIVGFSNGKNVYLPDEVQLAVNSPVKNNATEKKLNYSSGNKNPEHTASLRKSTNSNDSDFVNKNPGLIASNKKPENKKAANKNSGKVTQNEDSLKQVAISEKAIKQAALNENIIKQAALNEKIKRESEMRKNDSIKLAEQIRKNVLIDSLNKVIIAVKNKNIADSLSAVHKTDSALAAADSLKRNQKSKDSLAGLAAKQDTTKKKNSVFEIEKNWVAFNVGFHQVMNSSDSRVNGVNIGSEIGRPGWVAGINYGRHLWKGFFVNGNISASQTTYKKDPELVRFNKYINDYFYLPTSVANIPIYKDTMLNGYFLAAPVDTFKAEFGYTHRFSYVDGAINAGYTFKAGRFRFPVYAGYNFSFLLRQKTRLEIVKENFSQQFDYNDIIKRRNYSSFVFSLACEVRVFRRGYLFVEGRMKYSSSNISTTPGVNYKPFTVQVPAGYKLYF
ncbi:MAG: SPOR domain-containing protein [Bacteroidia bacterium]|nr:SPOR domain-containing protein [Bacteroidia bacterium]